MQYKPPKTKSLYDLDDTEEIKIPKFFNGDCDKLYISQNQASLTKIEIMHNSLRVYVDEENKKALCRFDGFIKIGSKNKNSRILQDIHGVLNDHIGKKIDDIFSAKLFL